MTNELAKRLQEKLGFCCCGDPIGNLHYVHNGLQIIEDRIKSEFTYEMTVAREKEVFGNDSSKYFFYYWCAKEELTEHGGWVPCWLTGKGKELLEELKEALYLGED